jgi:hypothetical protein
MEVDDRIVQIGPGQFRAPNGDMFYGQWNDEHKRHGRGLSVQMATGRQTVESYDNGKQTSKVVRRQPPHSVIQWLGPAAWPSNFTVFKCSAVITSACSSA